MLRRRRMLLGGQGGEESKLSSPLTQQRGVDVFGWAWGGGRPSNAAHLPIPFFATEDIEPHPPHTP